MLYSINVFHQGILLVIFGHFSIQNLGLHHYSSRLFNYSCKIYIIPTLVVYIVEKLQCTHTSSVNCNVCVSIYR